MKKILLHHCCAPCSPKVIEALQTEYEIVSFWYNPNIHMEDEFLKRKASLESYLEKIHITLKIDDEYNIEAWLKEMNGLSSENRCRQCYKTRLEKTSRTAERLGITCFTTTLLASPYQKHDFVKDAGAKAAELSKTKFVYKDLRANYYAGKDIAYKTGSYMQKYCGCVFSRDERNKNVKEN